MIAIISGSARPNSNTLKVAKAIEKICKTHNKETTIINFEGYDVPNYNEPFDIGNLFQWQKNTLQTLEKANCIFWLSPEYNWMPSAEILQFINRFGSKECIDIWDGKRMATVGVSAGIGGRLPAVTLKNVIDKVISFVGAKSHCFSSIQEVHGAQKVISENGDLLDNEYFNQSFGKFVSLAIADF